MNRSRSFRFLVFVILALAGMTLRAFADPTGTHSLSFDKNGNALPGDYRFDHGQITIKGAKVQASTRIIYASSSGCALDSDIDNGGGTDDTTALQAILDTAPSVGRLELVLDGVALISRPLAYSNHTTIRCLPGAGVFLANNAAGAMLTAKAVGATRYQTKDVSIIGGVWNGNFAGQTVGPNVFGQARGPRDEALNYYDANGAGHYFWKTGFWLHSTDGIVLRDVTIRNAMTFGLVLSNSRNIDITNLRVQWDAGGLSSTVNVPAFNNGTSHNWDGIHLWGNVDNLSIDRMYYNGDDDWISFDGSSGAPTSTPNIYANDPRNGVYGDGAISNVTAQNILLDNAGTGGRLLANSPAPLGAKSISNVLIRNVRGTVTGHSMLCDNAALSQIEIDGWHVTSTALDGNGRQLNSIYLGNALSIANRTVRLTNVDSNVPVYVPTAAKGVTESDGNLSAGGGIAAGNIPNYGGGVISAAGNILSNGVLEVTGSADPNDANAAWFWSQVAVGPTISGYQFDIRTGQSGAQASRLRVFDDGGVRIGGSAGSIGSGSLDLLANLRVGQSIMVGAPSIAGQRQFNFSGSGGEFVFEDRSQPTDAKRLDIYMSGGTTNFRALNDAGSGGITWLTTDNLTGATSIPGGVSSSTGTFSGQVAIGGGAPVKKVLSTTASLSFPTIAAGGVFGATVTLTGVTATDTLSVTPSGYYGIVTANYVSANTVSITIWNPTAAAISPAANAPFRVTALQF